jgi:hypothetical protein
VVAQARPQLTHLVINWCKATAPTQAKLSFIPTLQMSPRPEAYPEPAKFKDIDKW